jgi:hypothetical protein
MVMETSRLVTDTRVVLLTPVMMICLNDFERVTQTGREFINAVDPEDSVIE